LNMRSYLTADADRQLDDVLTKLGFGGWRNG
jgi:hypothetical protein